MKAPFLNLGEWIRRLGVQRTGWSPELDESVQPVQVVSDASSLVPPLLPPFALSGGSFTSNVARTWCAQFQCFAPGGALIRSLRIGNANAAVTRFEFGLRTTPIAFFAPQVGVVNNMAPEPVLGVWTVGDTAAPVLSPSDAQILVPANGTGVLDEMIFVPAGSCLIIEASGVAVVNADSSITWQEFTTQ